MTAEIAIINHHGIAVAADSAVTIGDSRVWKSTNKIFSLGPEHDIIIMVYGGSSFSSFPWETVVKTFKSKSKKSPFTSILDCVQKFTEFLKDPIWRDQLQSDLCVLNIILNEMTDLRNETHSLTRSQFRVVCKEKLESWLEIARNRDKCIDDLDKNEFLRDFRSQIDGLRNEIFEEHFPIYLKDLLDDYIFEYFIRVQCTSGRESGIVIAGFGSDDYHPQLQEIFVDGRCEDRVRVWSGRSANFAEQPSHPAQMMAFAQQDMTQLFMEGISSAYIGYFQGIIDNLLKKRSEDILDLFQGSDEEKEVERKIQERTNRLIYEGVGNDLSKLRQKHFIHPLMSNIRNLPREEMAAMAEALVELTSLRRKIDSTLQSVAGPVDVVFVSKADGVIWIKRKHYFDPTLNRDFMQRSNISGEAR